MKLITTAACVVLLGCSVNAAKGQQFQTLGDGPTELYYAYHYASQAYMELIFANDYASFMSILAAMEDLNMANEYFAANDIATAVMYLQGAILGHNDGIAFGLIDPFFINQDALAAAFTSGQGFVGDPGGSYKPVWYALWLAFYAYLDQNTWYF